MEAAEVALHLGEDAVQHVVAQLLHVSENAGTEEHLGHAGQVTAGWRLRRGRSFYANDMNVGVQILSRIKLFCRKTKETTESWKCA